MVCTAQAELGYLCQVFGEGWRTPLIYLLCFGSVLVGVAAIVEAWCLWNCWVFSLDQMRLITLDSQLVQARQAAVKGPPPTTPSTSSTQAVYPHNAVPRILHERVLTEGRLKDFVASLTTEGKQHLGHWPMRTSGDFADVRRDCKEGIHFIQDGFNTCAKINGLMVIAVVLLSLLPRESGLNGGTIDASLGIYLTLVLSAYAYELQLLTNMFTAYCRGMVTHGRLLQINFFPLGEDEAPTKKSLSPSVRVSNFHDFNKASKADQMTKTYKHDNSSANDLVQMWGSPLNNPTPFLQDSGPREKLRAVWLVLAAYARLTHSGFVLRLEDFFKRNCACCFGSCDDHQSRRNPATGSQTPLSRGPQPGEAHSFSTSKSHACFASSTCRAPVLGD